LHTKIRVLVVQSKRHGIDFTFWSYSPDLKARPAIDKLYLSQLPIGVSLSPDEHYLKQAKTNHIA
jgi:hypothetical protein